MDQLGGEEAMYIGYLKDSEEAPTENDIPVAVYIHKKNSNLIIL